MKHPLSIVAPWNTRYLYAKTSLYLIFLSIGGLLTFTILFPSQSFLFDFKNPQASKNTLLNPHTLSGETLEKGNISSKDTPLIIDAALPQGDYSLASVSLTPDKRSKKPTGTITLHRSYRAFFLPLGAPITQKAPDNKHFRSGSLLSFADGVFLIDGNQVRPIGDAVIFENLGYTWSDVVPASEEDMGMYEKGKMVILGNEHPDGTVFYDPETLNYFLIQNKEKHLIIDEATAATYLYGTHPIIVSEQSLQIEQSCSLIQSGLLQTNYECQSSLDTLKNLPGDSYRLTARFDDTVSFQSMDVIFSDSIDTNNMKVSLSRIKQRIFSHYGYGQ